MSPKKKNSSESTKSKKNPKSSASKTNTMSAKKKTTKQTSTKSEPSKDKVLGVKKRRETPNIFKIKSKKATPIVFSMDEVKDIIQKKKDKKPTPAPFTPKTKKGKPLASKKAKKTEDTTSKKGQVLGAASLADILGFNPSKKKDQQGSLTLIDEDKIEKKWLPYYRSLVKLHEHIQEGIDMHAQDTLKRSSKDDSGDLSGYGQHMADAGTDTFDRDFALSLLSSEQDALFEIEEAIQRIIDNDYGTCEITGKTIPRDRLKAVPFTRYSLEGQEQLEQQKGKNQAERGGVFAESSLEESAKFSNSSDSE